MTRGAGHPRSELHLDSRHFERRCAIRLPDRSRRLTAATKPAAHRCRHVIRSSESFQDGERHFENQAQVERRRLAIELSQFIEDVLYHETAADVAHHIGFE